MEIARIAAEPDGPGTREYDPVRNVKLAANLARHSALGWDNDALPDDYREIAALLRMEQEKVVVLVKAGPASAQA